MRRLYKYESVFFFLSVLPVAILFPYPIDLIPLAIQTIALIIFIKIKL